MTKELENSIDKIWNKLDQIQENEKQFDKRLTIHEEMQKLMQKDVTETKLKVGDLFDKLGKLEVKIAYAAGGFAVAVIIAQMVAQSLFH